MNRKRFISLLLAITIVVSLVPTLAVSSAANDEEPFYFSIYTPENGEPYAVLDNCNSSLLSGNVTVPAEYDGVPVKYITEYAFKDCTDIKAITIPENIEVISNAVFSGCTSLLNVSFPKSLKTVMSCQFINCPNLKNIFFADTESLFDISFHKDWAPENPWNLYLNNKYVANLIIPEGIESITNSRFFNCGSIKAVTFPESIKSIEPYAFRNCTGLSYITIPDVDCNIYKTSFNNTAYVNNENNLENGVIYIGNHLIDATKATGTVNIKDSVLTIADSAFSSSKANSVNIPDSVIRLSQSFANCTTLQSVTVGKGIKAIPFRCFDGCTALTTVDLSEGLEIIEQNAFSDCTALTTINLPNTLRTLINGLYNCTALKNLHIPSSLENIDLFQFKNNTALNNITFDNDHPQYTSEEGIVYNLDKTEIVFVPVSHSGIFTIPSNVVSIGDKALKDCLNITDVIFHDKLDYLGADAFLNTSFYNNLVENSEDGNVYRDDVLLFSTGEEVVIKEGITTIATNAINSETIRSLTLPASLKYVRKGFYAPNLEELHIHSLSTWLNVKYEDDTANILKMSPGAKIWMGEFCIETTIVPDDIDTIGAYKYANNPQFDFAIIPKTVTKIEPNAFWGCSERLIFRCHENSEAHRYAIENGIRFAFIKERNSDKTIVDIENNEIVTDEELLDDPEQILPEDLGSLISSLGTTHIYSLQIFGTGSKLVIIINGVRYEFTLIVRGDVNGDGVCDALDAEFLANIINGRSDVKDHRFRAMDTDDNNELSIDDYQQIVNKVVA